MGNNWSKNLHNIEHNTIDLEHNYSIGNTSYEYSNNNKNNLAMGYA